LRISGRGSLGAGGEATCGDVAGLETVGWGDSWAIADKAAIWRKQNKQSKRDFIGLTTKREITRSKQNQKEREIDLVRMASQSASSRDWWIATT